MPGRKTKRLVFTCVLAAGVLAALGWFCRVHYGVREFRNPVAYTMIEGRLFVMEKEGNRLLELTYAGDGRPLRLESARRVERDDADFFYMVRKLYPGPAGRLVTQSYIYDRETRAFAGYRFRAHDPAGRQPPLEILRVFFKDPARYPEMRYACSRQGDHYFLNTAEGQHGIWKLPATVAGVTARDDPPPGVQAMGETNDAWAGWNSIQVADDGRIFLASGAAGCVAVYTPDGTRLHEFGDVGVEVGRLLAPDDLRYMSFNPATPPALTVASTGNRTWLQFDARGRRIRLLNPLREGYPYADILTGGLFAHPELGACAFDLVNKCLVILGPPLRVVAHYRAPIFCGICMVVGLGVLGGGLILVALRVRRAFLRLRLPLFVKLLVLFVPLLLAGNLMVEHQVRIIMRADKRNEAVLRLANLSRAILNTVSLDDLKAINLPADRNGLAYERVYLAVSRILDAQNVPQTPKWIIHKIANNRFYFGINIWRGPIFEPFIVTPDRGVFLHALADKTPQFGRFQDDQGEWFSYISPIMDERGEVIYLLELYRPTEIMDRADHTAAVRARRVVYATALLLLVVILLFSWLFTRPVRRLMRATEIISAGGFEHRIDLRSRDELGDLAQAFNDMAGRLATFTEERARAATEQERLQAELRFARTMQSEMLPVELPPCPGMENLEVVARMEPAREIGGDYYDCFAVDEHHAGVLIADVAGKGVPAGMFLMEFRTLLRGLARGQCDAARVMSEINAVLSEDNPSVMFVTVFYMVCDLRTGHVVYCNAGHLPPFRRAGGVWHLLPESTGRGMAVGVDGNAAYVQGEFDLRPGDLLLLYTDGVSEAPDRTDHMFGEDGIRRLLAAGAVDTPADLTAALMRAVSVHQTGREQFDDVTVLTLRYNAPSPSDNAFILTQGGRMPATQFCSASSPS